ncbi:aryl-alcohol oxidase-like protein [Cyathus striatus]|nr:aryl-alcohol oxidase-like protein [Cyathus striatus]
MYFNIGLLIFYLALIRSSSAAIISDPSLVNGKGYDYIVVGAGTAGSVVASRLTEDKNAQVLLIEAGISNTDGDISAIQVPFLVTETAQSRYDWNYTTVPQKSLGNRILTYPRGFVLGGSSSINYMAYTRGPSDEYNRLAKLTGDNGWDWPTSFKYGLKSERHVQSADNHNTTGQFDPKLHGTSGPLLTSLPGNPTDIDQRVLNTTSQFALEFPFNLDMNGGSSLGFSWLQSTVGRGERSSSATAYLNASVIARPNLSILIQTRVTRLLPISQKIEKTPTLTKVELATSRNSPRLTVSARKEVVLSAGSIGTPQLLMLSGVGDKEELSKLKIPTVLDLPDVGNHLQDHPYLTLPWKVNSTSTFDTVVFNQTAFAAAFQSYERTHTGLFADNAIANHIGFLRLPKNSEILKKFGEPSAGPTSPHYEFAFCNGFVATTQQSPTSGNYFSIAVVLVSPSSRGSLTLTSSSVFDQPNIDPNYFSSEPDMSIMVEAVKSAKRFVSASAWNNYLLTPFGDSPVDSSSDSDIEAYIRASSISIRHPVSTARISSLKDKTGVVGPDLLVKGINGVRVVDASVLPFAPPSHPQAEIYILAERASDLIKGQTSV